MVASIIIITKNQKELLKQSLPVLLNQNLNSIYEIIIVDSGSTDGAKEYIKTLPIKLINIEPKTFNYASALNTGAKYAKGKYLVRLSGDVIPKGNRWLKNLLEPFKDKRVGATYGKYIITGRSGYGYPDYWPAKRFPDKVTRYSENPTPIMGINLFGLEFGDNKKRENVFNLAGGCCAIRKNIWEKRPFNEDLISAEDAEYAWFLHLIGYDIVYTPHAESVHEHKLLRSADSPFWKSWGNSKWQWVFSWNIAKYWLQKFLMIDPYKNLRAVK